MLPQKILILDTETISISKPYIYDIGVVVASLDNGVYKPIDKSQYIIEQIYDNQALFSTAYYETKRLLYTSIMKGRKAKKDKFGYSLQAIKRLMDFHEIDTVLAYNSPFDKKAIKFTSDFFNTKNVFENKKWLDIHAIANEFIHKKIDFIDYAKNNNFVNESGYLSTNAEITYRFLTKNDDFIEEHTSVSDCLIELDIFNKCIELGFDNTSEITKSFIESGKTQTLTVRKNGKDYDFNYVKKINRKGGVIELK